MIESLNIRKVHAQALEMSKNKNKGCIGKQALYGHHKHVSVKG